MKYKRGMFKGQKVTIMGLGLLGRGVGDAEFLAREGAELIVTDLKTQRELAPSLARLKKFKNISYTLGKHDFRDFEKRDFILKGADIPAHSPYISHAEKHGVKVLMSTALFASLTPAKVVGVTGTRGKSTVTQMIYEALKSFTRGKKQKVYLGGNVRGLSTLALLPKVKQGDLCVLELDSWQLHGFGNLKISPHLSVFTTFMPDHLNYYKGDLKKYFGDKANIFKFQKAGDISIIGNKVKNLGQKYPLPQDIKLKIVGEHNRYNAGLAYAALLALKVPKAVIKPSLEAFKGVPGRLERVDIYMGVTVYNDTTSTTPHALEVAIEALHHTPLVLIAGGSDKGIDLKILKSSLKICKIIVLLPGTGTDKLIKQKWVKQYVLVKDMKEAVQQAFKRANKGDTLLLSPGFASFGLFKNEFDRGDQFVAAVKKYITHAKH